MKITVIAAKQLPNPSTVKAIGKYLYQNIDGAFKIEFKPNKCIIHNKMYYQIPHTTDPLQELDFWIDITTYQNKIRVNLTENNVMEKTIGQLIVSDKDLEDLNRLRDRVLKAIDKFMNKEYGDEYEFVY